MFHRLFVATVVVALASPASVRAQSHIKAADAAELADSLTSAGRIHKAVEFEFGKRRIYSKTRERLAEIAQACRARPNVKIVVEGHAFAYDEETAIALGEMRADLVRRLLIRYGVDPKNVIAVDASKFGEPGRYVDLILEER